MPKPSSVPTTWTALSGELLEDLTRFNEAVDQALAESLEEFGDQNDKDTRLFTAVLAASVDPIFVLDIRGNLCFANQSTGDLFSLSHDALIGQCIFELGCTWRHCIRADKGG